MVEDLIEEMFRSDRNRPRDYETSRGRRCRANESEQDHSRKWKEKSAQKGFDRADIVRDVRLADLLGLDHKSPPLGHVRPIPAF